MIAYRRAAGSVFILAAVAAALAGATLMVTPPRPAADLGTVPAAPPAPATPTGPAPGATAFPERLQFPALGIDAPVRAVTVDRTGQLAVPDDPRQIGWWASGAAPGASAGTVVLAGTSTPPGPDPARSSRSAGRNPVIWSACKPASRSTHTRSSPGAAIPSRGCPPPSSTKPSRRGWL